MSTSKAPWRVIVALPYEGEVQGLLGVRNLFLLLLLTEVVLIFLGTLIVTRMVAWPLKRLTDAMHLTEGAHPRHVDIPGASAEIGVLKDTYNRMVDRIEVLFKRIEDESERKRQAEFHALQAQINPHFLYNTIDTARGLVMTGRAADVNRLLRNLGEFYRNSINNGRTVITLREEIHMVRSYMDIQQIRYAEIQTLYDVDDTLCDVEIPKLVLQPLVENALYHGLRPMGNKGTIEIRVYGDASHIYVSVSDDGVGIDPSVARRVFNEAGDPLDRFGLQGTLDRLRLYYKQDHVLSIEYGVIRGTRMTLMIPRQRENGSVEP
jgi:two-component system sensor histidine kinase YesM